jgi:hypothetical protein
MPVYLQKRNVKSKKQRHEKGNKYMHLCEAKKGILKEIQIF